MRGLRGTGEAYLPLHRLVLTKELSQSLSSCSSEVVALEREHPGQSVLVTLALNTTSEPQTPGSGEGQEVALGRDVVARS